MNESPLPFHRHFLQFQSKSFTQKQIPQNNYIVLPKKLLLNIQWQICNMSQEKWKCDCQGEKIWGQKSLKSYHSPTVVLTSNQPHFNSIQQYAILAHASGMAD